MTLVDLDSKDVQNYTNKDGLIAISDLRMLALADDYVEVDKVLEIIDKAQYKTITLADGSYVLHTDRSVLRDAVLDLKGGEQE